MPVALNGNLRDFGLAEVFQLIGQQRKTGLLEISTRGSRARLAFSDGAVVWAEPLGATEHSALGDMLVRCGLITRERLIGALRESEDSARSLQALLSASGDVSEQDFEQSLELLRRETIFQVLRWSSGSFHFTAQPVPHEQPPEKLLAAEQILMEGLRMLDEWRSFGAWVPSAETVFRRAGDIALYRQRATGHPRSRLEQAERVHRLVDGRLDTRRVIDLSRLGTFEGTRALAELRRAGAIEPVPTQSPAPRRSRLRSPIRLGAALRAMLAAVLPVALLLGVLSRVSEAPPRLESMSPANTHVFPVARAPLAQARQSFGKRRLRAAAQAAWYRTGRWPERLTELDVGDVADASLTSLGAADYYYSRSEAGVLLLAPRR